jgi:hypothetical protein
MGNIIKVERREMDCEGVGWIYRQGHSSLINPFWHKDLSGLPKTDISLSNCTTISFQRLYHMN